MCLVSNVVERLYAYAVGVEDHRGGKQGTVAERRDSDRPLRVYHPAPQSQSLGLDVLLAPSHARLRPLLLQPLCAEIRWANIICSHRTVLTSTIFIY